MKNENMYLVYLEDTSFEKKYVTVCDGGQDLSNLLMHLDKEKYLITKVDTVNGVFNETVSDYKEFFVENKDIETGTTSKEDTHNGEQKTV